VLFGSGLAQIIVSAVVTNGTSRFTLVIAMEIMQFCSWWIKALRALDTSGTFDSQIGASRSSKISRYFIRHYENK
jgi:hypothetical protein